MVHALEHLHLWDARTLLKSLCEMLSSDGKLILELPDIQYAVNVLAGVTKAPSSHYRFTMWPLYGDPSHRDPSYSHKWGYTPESLGAELNLAGFSRWEFKAPEHHNPAAHPGRDMRCEAFK